jgi:hypothetical protein
MDKGYDLTSVDDGCKARDVRPIIPLRETPGVNRGDRIPPCCEHGEWRFAGADYGRKGTKWRCPTREYKPVSRWTKADRLHRLILRDSPLLRASPPSCCR